MFTWAHMNDDELVIDWIELNKNMNMFDNGYRNKDAEMAKLISVVSRRSWEAGFVEGLKADGAQALLHLTGGNG